MSVIYICSNIITNVRFLFFLCSLTSFPFSVRFWIMSLHRPFPCFHIFLSVLQACFCTVDSDSIAQLNWDIHPSLAKSPDAASKRRGGRKTEKRACEAGERGGSGAQSPGTASARYSGSAEAAPPLLPQRPEWPAALDRLSPVKWSARDKSNGTWENDAPQALPGELLTCSVKLVPWLPRLLPHQAAV